MVVIVCLSFSDYIFYLTRTVNLLKTNYYDRYTRRNIYKGFIDIHLCWIWNKKKYTESVLIDKYIYVEPQYTLPLWRSISK